MKTLQNLEAGDLITDGIRFMNVMVNLGGKDKMTCLLMSGMSSKKDAADLKSVGAIWTAYNLEQLGFTLYLTPEDKTEELIRKYACNTYDGIEYERLKLERLLRDFAKDLFNNK